MEKNTNTKQTEEIMEGPTGKSGQPGVEGVSGESPQPKLTQEQLDMEAKRLDYQRYVEGIGKEYDELTEKVSGDKYREQGYPQGATIEIDTEFFNELTQTLAKTNEHMHNVMGMFTSFVELTSNRLLSLNNQVLRTHVRNVDAGNSSSFEEIEKSKSAKKVVEIDN